MPPTKEHGNGSARALSVWPHVRRSQHRLNEGNRQPLGGQGRARPRTRASAEISVPTVHTKRHPALGPNLRDGERLGRDDVEVDVVHTDGLKLDLDRLADP